MVVVVVITIIIIVVVIIIIVELFISNKYYCWRGQARVMATGLKSVTFRVGNAHFPFFTHKIFIPVQVKP